MDRLSPGIPQNELPGLQPPPGVVSNFTNPGGYQPTIIGTLTACLTIATTFTAVRLYNKAFLVKSIALEDYASIIAWLGLTVLTTLFAMTLDYGNGIHQWDVPLSKLLQFGKLANAAAIVYCIVIFFTKLAILLQIQNIFVTSKQSIRFLLIQLLIWANGLWYLINMLFTSFACKPRAKAWNPVLPGHCLLTLNTKAYVETTLNMVSDIFILTLPILWVWKLQMATSRKLGISLIFATGIFACLASIMRLRTTIIWYQNPDQTYYLSYGGLWTFGEITGGIVCACLPMLPRPTAILSSQLSSRLSRYRSSRTGGLKDSHAKIMRGRRGKRLGASGDPEDYVELGSQNVIKRDGTVSMDSKRSENVLDLGPRYDSNAV